jgi:hypothetical protein
MALQPPTAPLSGALSGQRLESRLCEAARLISNMRVIRITVAALICIAGVGCHSALISATIANHTAVPVTLVEVDYPSASFGVQKLAPGEEYHYRFKVLGNGATTLLWSEPAKRDQKSSGPALREGDEGTLNIAFEAGGPIWNLELSNRASR